ncbi:MAG TPA: SDR family NAD(P)-dependent oxidoreductase [Roseomonas sp.]|nr:SDR family NAD(P)-dependent oxidoreductase [Roseomonas sp.]
MNPQQPEKAVLVTGAARGVGHAVAARLVRGGYRVALCDVAPGAAATAAAGLGAAAAGFEADVSDEASVATLFARLADWCGGRLYGVVNNAGIAPAAPPEVEAMPLEHWSRVLAVNLTGAFLVCRAAVPLLRANGAGRIVNIASRAARTHSPTVGGAYAASKAGLVGFSRSLAGEVGPAGITVNVIAPARIATPMTRGAADTEARDQRTIAATPLRRVGQPEDIAGSVAFLLSDDAAFMTGAILDVTGGSFMP